MQHIVILTSDTEARLVNELVLRLSTPKCAAHVVDIARPFADVSAELENQTSGKMPSAFVADLSQSTDCLQLHHVHRLCRAVWSDEALLSPLIAIFTPDHLEQPEWPAFVDDFVLVGSVRLELAARLRQLMFRQQQKSVDETIKFADVKIESDTGRVRDAGSGEAIALTPREAELLAFLVLHRGKFFARDRLLDLVWGVDYEGGERTVDIHVRRLRSKLPPGAGSLLETRRGVGYGFRLPD